MAKQIHVAQDLQINEISRSYSDAPHSVGLLWTSDQPDAETSLPDNTQNSQQTFITPGGIRTRNPCKRATAGPRLRPHDQRDQQVGQFVCFRHDSPPPLPPSGPCHPLSRGF